MGNQKSSEIEMCNIKKIQSKNDSLGQQWRRRHRRQTCGHSGEERAGQTERVALKRVLYHMQSRTLLRDTGSSRQTWLPVTPRAGDGVGGGKAVQEGGDMLPMADSCWCIAETNTIL